MQAHARACEHIPTDASIRWHAASLHMLAYANTCWDMRTYADIICDTRLRRRSPTPLPPDRSELCLGKGFLTQIADFSKESLCQSSSKWISLSGSSWGRDSLPKLVISVRNPCVGAPTKVFPCLGATVERIPKQIVYFNQESLSQGSPKGISLSRSSCREGSLP